VVFLPDKYSMILKEYLNIVTLIIESDNFYMIENEKIAVEKELVVKLLTKHNYLNLKEKLNLWRTLNFFYSENNRYTVKRVVEKNDSKIRTRFMVINTKPFVLLKKYICTND
jgi:hypothetical protein